MSDFMTAGLKKAIAKGALVKHRDHCVVCTDDYACEVAQMHLRMLGDVGTPPAPTSAEEKPFVLVHARDCDWAVHDEPCTCGLDERLEQRLKGERHA